MKNSKLNIIVLMSDSLRPDYLGCYGNPRAKTPNIDKLAREGILFEHVVAEQPITVPARNAYSLGMYTFPWLGWEPLPDNFPILQKILAREGYTTALIGDMGPPFKPEFKFCVHFQHVIFLRRKLEEKKLEGAERLFSWDKYHKEYTHPKEREGYLKGHVIRSGPSKDGGERAVTEASLKWLEEHRNEKFFLWVDYLCPHEPWDPPEKYFRMYAAQEKYSGPRISLPRGHDKFDWTPEELDHIRNLYQGDVSLIDEYIGKFLSGLAELGLDNNTIVALISDHGVPLGERDGIVRKVRPILNREQVEVVQILRMPDGPKGKRISALCQNFDLTTTLLSLIGVNAPETMEGKDLSSLIENEEKIIRDKVFCGWKGRFGLFFPVSVRTEEWVYIRYPEQIRRRYPREKENELYNISKDPWEQNNLIHEEKEIAEKLDSMIDEFLRQERLRISKLSKQ